MKCKYGCGCQKEATRFARVKNSDSMVIRCEEHWENFKQHLVGAGPQKKSVEIEALTEDEAVIFQIQRD